tara:strand:+ start:43 stop:471 length:429 start_codon:yes stop_codon:yes gene_type:complete
MKKYLILIISLSIFSCDKRNVVASSGESMWVILNHVKADKRQEFEKFVYEILLPALKEDAKVDLTSKKIIEQTRMLEPSRSNKDSSYTYIWLMDPIVKDADYSYPGILNKVYSPEETKKYISMNDECLVSPQIGYRVKRGSW